MKSTFAVAAAAVAMLTAAPAAAGALLDGKTVGLRYFYPSLGTPYTALQEVTVAPGNSTNLIGYFDVELGDRSVYVDYFTSATWSGGSFNGFVLSDFNGTVADFTGVSVVSTNLAGFDASRVSFDANAVYLNWQGLTFNQDTYVELAISGGDSVGAVPEPGAWALMILGFGAAGAALRRGRRTAAVCA